MALNSDAASQLTPEQVKLIEDIEKAIDDWLSRKYSGAKEAKCSFQFKAAGLATEKVVKELSERYRKAGWQRAEITYNVDHPFMNVSVVLVK